MPTQIGAISIPKLPPAVTDKELAFFEEALKLVKITYEEDKSDMALAMALYEKMESDSDLERQKESWTESMMLLIERASQLEDLQPVFEQLNIAFKDAVLIPDYGLYKNIDHPACRTAFDILKKTNPEAEIFEINIAQMGQLPLIGIEMICTESYKLSIAKIRMPTEEGSRKMRRLAQRIWTKAYPSEKIKKIAVPRDWIVEGDFRTLKFVLGIQPDESFPGDPCVKKIVTMSQEKSGRRWVDTRCCEIIKSVPIACDAIE